MNDGGNALARLSAATTALAEAKTLDEVKSIRDLAQAAQVYAKAAKMGLEAQNHAAEVKLRAERKFGQLLIEMKDNLKNAVSIDGQPILKVGDVLAQTGTTRQEANRLEAIASIADDLFVQWIEDQKIMQQEITTAGALRFGKKLNRETTAEPEPAPMAERQPTLIVGRAEELTGIDDESVNVIVTSPPYNLGSNHWDMGYRGERPSGIGYDDAMSENDYRDWQRVVIKELYRVAAPGASLFYNHKVRIKSGQASLPTDWVRGFGWTLRQVIIWDRTSTHNHEPRLFWPHDEWVLWMTKGKPDLRHPINMPSVWRFHGPTPNTWHPAPFSEELPQHCLQAVGFSGCVVLDPFAGSCTTVKVALEMGYEAIGVDVSADYLRRAAAENGWRWPSD